MDPNNENADWAVLPEEADDLAKQYAAFKSRYDCKPVRIIGTVSGFIKGSVRRNYLLMAGKVHALVTRKYSKGRDWYDLMWYRGKHPPIEPNLVQLQNALDQTAGEDKYDSAEWKQDLIEIISHLDTSRLIADVRDFLENPNDATLLTAENMRSILGSEME